MREDTRTRNQTPLAIIWRQKATVIAVLLTFVVVVAIVSTSLGKVYKTSSTLLVSLPAHTQSFDTVQASQAVARSYVDIIDSPNIARLVAERLGASPSAILNAVKFDTVTDTQLMKITAEASTPRSAKLLADTYATVFTEYAAANLAGTTKATLSVADPAPLHTSPARPKPTLYTLLGAILGLAIGLGLAFLRDRLDRRLRTSEDVEAAFDQPILARLPRRGRSDASGVAFREAARTLRTNIEFSRVGGRPRSIAIMSGGEGEGKTTTVANLALASAEFGLNVLVVEADLRRPALQKALMPERPAPLRPGLTNYLVETESLDDVIHVTNRPNLDIIPAGPLPPSPPALLQSHRGRTAVAEFVDRADLVIVDCPPLSAGADASIISGWVDGVLVLVDLETSTDRTVRDALRQLAAVHAPVLGLVVNRDRGVGLSYGYYSTSGDGGAPEPLVGSQRTGI